MMSSQRIIPAIHACRKQVAGLDDETTWRAFLARTVGTESLRAMTGPQLGRVLDALHEAGAPRRTRPRLPDPQQRMARGLWIDLHRAGAVRDGSDGALDAFVKRTVGVTTLAWCRGRDMVQVIEALKSWRARYLRQCLAGVAEQVVQTPGWSRDQMMIVTLWELLQSARAVSIAAELWTWLSKHYEGAKEPTGLTPEQAEDAVWQLATWLRRKQAAR